MATSKKKKARTVAMSGRLTPDEKQEVIAYAERMSTALKMRIGPCVALGMLVREGLATVARNAVAS